MKLLASRQCKKVRNQLSEVVLGDLILSEEHERHAAQCLVCQAEIAQYKTIDRGFASMRNEIATAPANLVHRVMAGLDRTPIPWFRRKVAVSVSAASAVAVAATVAIAVRRRQAAA